MKQMDAQRQVVEDLRKWQVLENAAMASCTHILEKTDHPLMRIVAETILRDSQNHHNIQQLLLDSLELKPIALTPEDVGDIWDALEKHTELERKTVEMATKLLAELKGGSLTAQRYLLQYLLIDEEKHNRMLEMLEQVKKNVAPGA